MNYGLLIVSQPAWLEEETVCYFCPILTEIWIRPQILVDSKKKIKNLDWFLSE